jgi:hypothetical protein
MDNNFKLADIPSTVSAILGLPFPFSNLGNFHPALTQHSSLVEVKYQYE